MLLDADDDDAELVAAVNELKKAAVRTLYVAFERDRGRGFYTFPSGWGENCCRNRQTGCLGGEFCVR